MHIHLSRRPDQPVNVVASQSEILRARILASPVDFVIWQPSVCVNPPSENDVH